ncbi:hypothetical protein ACFRIB_34590 [Streptomyces mirabilis]|uniref:hypothetical protein n=1 Tax=Streptomyces mirabilis TaxID=68239 RepID=UPI0036C8EB41
MRRDQCGGSHRFVCFTEVASGVDRPDEDASDQRFACLGFGIPRQGEAGDDGAEFESVRSDGLEMELLGLGEGG